MAGHIRKLNLSNAGNKQSSVGRRTRKGSGNCPSCGSDGWKVYVNPENGGWFCFAGQHHAGGTVDVGLSDEPGTDLLNMLEHKRKDPVWSETCLPPFAPLSHTACTYLYGRGMTNEELKSLGLVEWVDQERILIPYFNGSGELIWWTSRTYAAAKPKYLSNPGAKPLYEPRMPGHDVRNKDVVLVEGPFDAIAVARAGYTALALGGKSLPQYHVKNVLTKAPRGSTIWVLLDNDALLKAIDVSATLSRCLPISGWDVQIRFCPVGKDPGDMTPEGIKDALYT